MPDREPFLVVLVGADMAHRYVKGFETREAADASCKERNARAEMLGIDARYEVVEAK